MRLLPAVVLLGLALAWAPAPGRAAQDGPGVAASGLGKATFRGANCVGCHKWFGGGGGGYGGPAANLRETALTREQIVETVSCGRPGTGMPYFREDAYADGGCYGLKAADLDEASRPLPGDHFLQPREISAVADFVVRSIKGRGPPTLEECQAFFGEATHLCASFPPAAGGAASASAGERGPAEVEAAPDANAAPGGHGRLAIETAPDANAPGAK
ncbi:MAG: c-type cytochrome [Janthinobacterium lividum]